jgi:hypothetical protein
VGSACSQGSVLGDFAMSPFRRVGLAVGRIHSIEAAFRSFAARLYDARNEHAEPIGRREWHGQPSPARRRAPPTLLRAAGSR